MTDTGGRCAHARHRCCDRDLASVVVDDIDERLARPVVGVIEYVSHAEDPHACRAGLPEGAIDVVYVTFRNPRGDDVIEFLRMFSPGLVCCEAGIRKQFFAYDT